MSPQTTKVISKHQCHVQAAEWVIISAQDWLTLVPGDTMRVVLIRFTGMSWSSGWDVQHGYNGDIE